MAAPSLPVGTYVQYNAAVDSPRSAPPSTVEETVGIIRQAIMAQGQTFYQVVWSPGDATPRSAFYRPEELIQIQQKDAQSILQQIAQGTYQPQQQTPGSAYVQPNIPAQALPPGLSTLGTFSATQQPTTNPPELQQTG